MQAFWAMAGVRGVEAEWMLAALLGAVAVLLVTTIWLWLRVRHLSRSYARLMAGTDGGSLEKALHQHLDRVAQAVAHAEAASNACAEVDRRLDRCVQHPGLVRFDAFDDVGGSMSFALALLDGAGDGVVLSSLHGRHESRLFAKPVRSGRSEVPLTVEEEEALRQVGWEAEAPRAVRLTHPEEAP